MRIMVNEEYGIKTDPNNIILFRTYKGQNGEMVEDNVAYHSDWERALWAFARNELLSSQATTFAELLTHMSDIRQTIKESVASWNTNRADKQ